MVDLPTSPFYRCPYYTQQNMLSCIHFVLDFPIVFLDA